METVELKRCPFCGGEAIFPKNGISTFVICTKCGATSCWCTSKAEAAELWNRRADDERN